MDWIEKAAENFKKQNDSAEKYNELNAEFQESYPHLVESLWNMFEKTFDEIKSKFGDSTGFEANGNTMRLVIGDVMITGVADNGKYLGGIHGAADISYEVHGQTGTVDLPVDRILIYDLENPSWMYFKDHVNGRKLVPFQEEDIQEIYRTALSIYLR